MACVLPGALEFQDRSNFAARLSSPLIRGSATNAGMKEESPVKGRVLPLLGPSGWHKPKNLIGLESASVLQTEYRIPIRKCAHGRALQYEMTGAQLGNVPAEAAVLVGDANGEGSFLLPPEGSSSPSIGPLLSSASSYCSATWTV
jgi:hypothetical protein